MLGGVDLLGFVNGAFGEMLGLVGALFEGASDGGEGGLEVEMDVTTKGLFRFGDEGFGFDVWGFFDVDADGFEILMDGLDDVFVEELALLCFFDGGGERQDVEFEGDIAYILESKPAVDVSINRDLKGVFGGEQQIGGVRGQVFDFACKGAVNIDAFDATLVLASGEDEQVLLFTRCRTQFIERLT